MAKGKKVSTKAKAIASGSNVLPVAAKPGTTREQLIATIAAKGTLATAATVRTYSQPIAGEADILQLVTDLQGAVKASQAGDTGIADAYLIPQANALSAIFNECMRRAYLNMGGNPDAMERYMRLGLKAQSQCRSSLESLSKIKNPPNVSFVKQANIANGPQQVNNGVEPATSPAQDSARTSASGSAPIELLEDSNGQWVDTRAPSEARSGDPQVAAVGSVDRAAQRRGQARK